MLVQALEPVRPRCGLRGPISYSVDIPGKLVSDQRSQRVITEVPDSPDIEILLDRKPPPVVIQEGLSKTSRGKKKGRVTLAELMLFTRQLGTMVSARLTLVQALQLLAEQTRNQLMSETIQDLRRRIEAGGSLSDAIAKHPNVFNQFYVSMVAGGEKAGLLPVMLTRLAKTLESTTRLRRKVKSAVTYPILIIVVALVVASFLLISVVPVFGEVFRTFGADLPAPTRFLIALGKQAKYALPVALLALGVGTYLWLYFISTPFGRHFWDSLCIRLPVFGNIAHKLCLARFARTFGSLLRSGVPILEVFDITSRTVGNVVLEKAIKSAATGVEQGLSVSDALGKYPVFSNTIVRMVASGEQTGEIDTMLENVADLLDEETEIALAGLTLLIEPILIVFLGVFMGGMVICMFLPIFKLPEIVNGTR